MLSLALLGPAAAQEEFPFDIPEDDGSEGAEQPIAVELLEGIELLNNQITQQQELVKNAKTEREQSLIRNHIRLLEKEKRTLESLLHKLVGPHFDVKQEAEEQAAEQRDERKEQILEREDRSGD